MGSYSGDSLRVSYSSIQLSSSEDINLTLRGRSVSLFIDPNYFPMEFGGERINLCILYGKDREEMKVQLLSGTLNALDDDLLYEESMDVFGMSDYQKMVAFLYLLGVVVNDS